MSIIGVTMGDASGVGPEIALKAYRDGDVAKDFVLIGDMSALAACNTMLGLGVPLHAVSKPNQAMEGALNVLDLGLLTAQQLRIGEMNADSGRAARDYVVCAVNLAKTREIGAIVTLPMNKEATRLSDPGFTGHTELIAGMCGEENYTMMLCSDRLTVTHVSTHVSMAEAVKLVQKERILDVIRLTNEALRGVVGQPRIAVAGLNAHAGEHGSFGREEIDEIVPAVEAAKAEGIHALGPVAPDTVFYRALKGDYDAVVCMYHDQGHIPMKLLDFEGGVNVTLGLPIIRTSVDHGTAFDIAYRGIASTGSYVLAFRLAQKMAAAKR
jgi:4-hydroxythreonine-4-phosphate dehydrogenase